MEDKWMIGWPDCLFIPKFGPVFFAEVKLVLGAHLICTVQQAHRLKELTRPPAAIAVLIGYSKKGESLHIGRPGDHLHKTRFVPRPRAIDSSEWWITELLAKFMWDNYPNQMYPQGVSPENQVPSPHDTAPPRPD
jgi:hypothetical protein